MARSYSVDLRQRVVCAVTGGMSQEKTAEVFQVGIATVVRWMGLFRKTGSVEPKTQGGDRRSHVIESYADVLLDTVAQAPDITLVEIQKKMEEETGKHLSVGSLWRFYDRHGITFKKSLARSRTEPPGRRETPSTMA